MSGGPVASPPELDAGAAGFVAVALGAMIASWDGDETATGAAVCCAVVGVGAGVEVGVGRAVGAGVVFGVGLGVAFGVGFGVGRGVGFGVGFGVAGEPTTTTLPLKPWIVHAYTNVPAFVNVCV